MPSPARSTSRSTGPGCTPSCSRSRCWRSSTRSISATPRRCRISAQGRSGSTTRLRCCTPTACASSRSPTTTPAGVSRPGRGGAARADRAPGRGAAGQFAGTSNVLFAMKLGLTPGHHGARVPAGLPGAGPAPARQPGLRLRVVGQGIPRGTCAPPCPTCTASTPSCATSTCISASCSTARATTAATLCWGERLIEHYRKNRVDPLTKTLIFSDSLTVPRTIELYQRFKDPLSAGLRYRTNLTNYWAIRPACAAADRDQDGALHMATGGQTVRSTGQRACATRNTWPTCGRCSRSATARAWAWPARRANTR